MPSYPAYRARRLRSHPTIRRLVQETRVTRDDLIYPIFVTHAETSDISSMPGIRRFSLKDLCKELEEVAGLGIPGVILFGIPSEKDASGCGAYDPDGIIPQALRAARKTVGNDLLLIADVCLCGYTSHGHCGVIEEARVQNDPTLELLVRAACVYAEAGADIVAPSDMMDGRIGAIRRALDEYGFTETSILAYSVKYASAFYGPFREAADNAPQFGDRRSYQMDPHNRREARKEAALDVEEGADILMVKPALAYLDVISDLHRQFTLPIAAYNVSGEYAMLKAAALNGWIDEERAIVETLTSIKRAGADIILTYHSKEFARRGLDS
jgi:porphobilinogen synthase